MSRNSRTVLGLVAAASLGAAPASAGLLEDQWVDFAFHRCTEPVIRNAQIVTGDLVEMSAIEANRIDIRSDGVGWQSPDGRLILVNMEHDDGTQTYRGCRVAFPISTATTVPVDVSAVIASFEQWIEQNTTTRTFRDVECNFGTRTYARKIKTRGQTREGVNVSIVIEAGVNDSFLFFAAVEEPVGVGECINESG